MSEGTFGTAIEIVKRWSKSQAKPDTAHLVIAIANEIEARDKSIAKLEATLREARSTFKIITLQEPKTFAARLAQQELAAIDAALGEVSVYYEEKW